MFYLSPALAVHHLFLVSPRQRPAHHLCRITIRLGLAQTLSGHFHYSSKVLGVGMVYPTTSVWHVTGHKETNRRHLSAAGKLTSSVSTNGRSTTPPGTGTIFMQISGIQESHNQQSALKKYRCQHQRLFTTMLGTVEPQPPRSVPIVSSLKGNSASPASWTIQKFNCTCP